MQERMELHFFCINPSKWKSLVNLFMPDDQECFNFVAIYNTAEVSLMTIIKWSQLLLLSPLITVMSHQYHGLSNQSTRLFVEQFIHTTNKENIKYSTLLQGNPLVIRGFSSQRARNVESIIMLLPTIFPHTGAILVQRDELWKRRCWSPYIK